MSRVDGALLALRRLADVAAEPHRLAGGDLRRGGLLEGGDVDVDVAHRRAADDVAQVLHGVELAERLVGRSGS